MESILDLIGNTPLVRINGMNPNPKVTIYAKLEGFNPGGSVKDRIAKQMVLDAEDSGELGPGKAILEPTSGNTGIGLAIVARVRGYPIRIVMSEGVSQERQDTLKALGAELILTPAAEKTDGAIRKAHEMLKGEPDKYWMPNQFDNPSNPRAHYEGTGQEIIDQVPGKVDVFVAGIGTSGTLMGAGKRLKEANPGVRLVGVEPVIGHGIQGLKSMKESIVPGIFNPGIIDEKIIVRDAEANETARQLAKKEGLFVGMSSGAAMVGALRVAGKMEKGNVVVIFPDRGDRYLSTGLFCIG
jgi:cysteine synthase B